MKPFDYYDNPNESLPNQKDFTTIYVYNKGEVLWSGTGKTYEEARNQFPSATIEREIDEKAYDKAWEDYHAAPNVREEEFIKDLFEEFGVTNNPKKELCYSIAYDIGHAYGFSEIYNKFYDLVELIK
jgi:hypothetical protein